jgi:orotate phosphoribosyltransferase
MNERFLDQCLFKGYFTAGKLNSPRIGNFPFYIDNRTIFSHIDKLKIAGEELAKIVGPWQPDLIAAQEAAGVPFGLATALELKKDFLYLRKEPKNYNTTKLIEGVYHSGQRVVIIDDAISTGGGKKGCVELLENAGLQVVGIAVLIDAYYGAKYRAEQAWLREEKKYQFASVVTWPQIMDYAAKRKFLGQELCDLIKEFLEDPREWQKSEENWKRFKDLAGKETNLIFTPNFKDI